ncbi:hypothetical protein Bpfe_022720, partial [Biomphalaria pfeifferi]
VLGERLGASRLSAAVGRQHHSSFELHPITEPPSKSSPSAAPDKDTNKNKEAGAGDNLFYLRVGEPVKGRQ